MQERDKLNLNPATNSISHKSFCQHMLGIYVCLDATILDVLYV